MDTKQWYHRTVDNHSFLISTSRALLPTSFIEEAFASPDMYWGTPATLMSPGALKTMLDNSCTLGLYKVQNGDEDKSISAGTSPAWPTTAPSTTNATPIGLARLITDYATFAYLTDVYIDPSYRGLGLGRWLIHCCREVVAQIADLRWMMLRTDSEDAARMYKRDLGMQFVDRIMGARLSSIREVMAGGDGGVVEPGKEPASPPST